MVEPAWIQDTQARAALSEFSTDPCVSSAHLMDLTLICLLVALFALALNYLMGCGLSKKREERSDAPVSNKNRIGDNFHTLQEVEAGLRKAGLESSDLILASVTDSTENPDC
jgi:hypothetical protein